MLIIARSSDVCSSDLLQSAQKSARSTTDQATHRTAEAKTAAVRILGHKVRHNEIIRGLHLSAADIGTNLQLAAVRQSAFQVAALQAFAAVNKTKATGFHNEYLDHRFGRTKIQPRTPFVIRLAD